MNRLRGIRVLVDLAQAEESRDTFDQTESGIYVEKDKRKEAFLTQGVIVKTGHEVNPADLKAGDVVYVKKSQGERLSPDNMLYLFPEQAIIGND